MFICFHANKYLLLNLGPFLMKNYGAVAHMVSMVQWICEVFHLPHEFLDVIDDIQSKQTLIGCKELQIPSYRVNQFLVLSSIRQKYIWNQFTIVILSTLLYSCVSDIILMVPSTSYTLPETNSSPPTMDHWKTTFLWEAYFQGRTVNFREGKPF